LQFAVAKNEEVVERQDEVQTPCNCPLQASIDPCCHLSANVAVPRLPKYVRQSQAARIEIPQGEYDIQNLQETHFLVKFYNLVKRTFL
jgi:hypothetical protein